MEITNLLNSESYKIAKSQYEKEYFKLFGEYCAINCKNEPIIKSPANMKEYFKNKNYFTTLMKNCSGRILLLFKEDDKLHIILKIFFNNIVNFMDDTCIENMQKLLQLLNSMTTENMNALYNVLNTMTPANMQKLLLLLNSMTPENMQKLLEYLIPLDQKQITDMLNQYIELNKNPKSMAQLLELYSFIETKSTGDLLVHRYLHGKTPFSQQLLRNKKHKPETCSSVAALDKQVRNIFNEGAFTFTEDKEFQNVLAECSQHPPSQQVSGGGRKRKTLKKKRMHGNKR